MEIPINLTELETTKQSEQVFFMVKAVKFFTWSKNFTDEEKVKLDSFVIWLGNIRGKWFLSKIIDGYYSSEGGVHEEGLRAFMEYCNQLQQIKLQLTNAT